MCLYHVRCDVSLCLFRFKSFISMLLRYDDLNHPKLYWLFNSVLKLPMKSRTGLIHRWSMDSELQGASNAVGVPMSWYHHATGNICMPKSDANLIRIRGCLISDNTSNNWICIRFSLFSVLLWLLITTGTPLFYQLLKILLLLRTDITSTSI